MKEEINFIMKYKPSFILMEKNKEGVHALHNFFVKEKGFEIEVLRTLIVKYPFILGKTPEHLTEYFNLMSQHGLSETEAMSALLECPKLISRDNLSKDMKEIFFMFNLYHGIKEQ